jgi:hypothetical protein
LVINEELSYDMNMLARIKKKVVDARDKYNLNKLLIQLQPRYQDVRLSREIWRNEEERKDMKIVPNEYIDGGKNVGI